MIKHFLTVIYRNFLRSKGYFMINVAGLALGIACTTLIYLWVKDELGMNKFHANDANLYQVMENQQYSDNLMTTTSTPGILAENLKVDFPDVKYSVETSWISPHTLSVKDHNVKAEGFHASPDFFQAFSFPLTQGDASKVLVDKMSIVISESLAIKVFGTTDDVVGKSIDVDHDKSYLVTGVFQNIGTNSTMRFEFVQTFEDFKSNNPWLLDWGSNGPPCYLVLHEGKNPVDFAAKIKDYVKGKNKDSNVSLFLQQYSDRYLHGAYSNGVQTDGRILYVRLFSIVAVFVLVIACINFMNLSTARATRKYKEVGIKKSVGAGRESLALQFLSESLITSFLAMFLAIGLVYLFLPAFNVVTLKSIRLDLTDPMLIGWLLGTSVITGLVAGSYPALYLSGFKPAAVLKGEVRGSLAELWARKGLVVFQFALSVFLIAAVIVLFRQIDYVQKQNLGYEKENLIQFDREGKLWSSLSSFLTELRRIPGVKNASSIGHGLLGQNSNTSGLEWEGKNPEESILFEAVRCNYDMMETLGVTMVEGRMFQDGNAADSSKIVFNEAAIKVMGLEDPIGKHIKLWGEDMEIVGVVKDFNFQSMHDPVKPLFFKLEPTNTWVIMARLEAGREKETLEAIEKLYLSSNPGFSFEYRFQDQEYAQLYAAEQRVATLASYFAIIAIGISCLGLFGLAAFTAERRMKEIGIRKALGSSSSNIVLLLSADFTKMVLISVAIGLPLAYWALNSWMERFAYRAPLTIAVFVGAGATALAVAWITVATQAIRASRANPVTCLRTE